jgi:hypothetical protein
MNDPPRPSSLGEILDRTAYFYRSRFLVLFGIAAVPTAVVLVFASGVFLFFAWFGSAGAGSVPNVEAGLLAGLLLVAIGLLALPIFLGLTALATAAMNHAANQAWRDEKITIRAAYRAAWRKGWRYIGLYALEALLIGVAPFVAGFLLLVFSAGATALAKSAGLGASVGALFGIVAFLFVVALLAYFFWMLLRLSLCFPACVVEQIRPWAAIKRSTTLTKGTRGRIFLLYLLGTALNYLLSMVVTVPILIVTALMPGANSPQHEQTTGMVMLFAMYGAAFAIQAFTRPVYGVAFILFYYDQRIRQEGFDIEWMMQQAGLVAPAPLQPEAAPWLPPIQPKAEVPEAAMPAATADGDTALPAQPTPPPPGDPA